ncbi:hypothetical protein V1525DRAFT_404294 [Lipomyces kononenkoae]|uniref:Uncharacterized protein n=1 Tax=Lipomyces kononenkoae TaxID=34357 RepID=A0ACC3T047_LIPKO
MRSISMRSHCMTVIFCCVPTMPISPTLSLLYNMHVTPFIVDVSGCIQMVTICSYLVIFGRLKVDNDSKRRHTVVPLTWAKGLQLY